MDYLSPYSHLRGFNYTPSTAFNDIAFWRDYDERTIERELTYAQRLGLNAARVFLACVVYEREPDAFLRRLQHFVRTAHQRGISTMPVVWDSCFDETRPAFDSAENKWIPNPGVQRLGADFWPAGERYCRDLSQALGAEPGLLMWDVMNEPTITSWLAAGPEQARRRQTVWTFVRHFCAAMKSADPQHPVTAGVACAAELPEIGADVDVLSFHDYRSTRAEVRAHIAEALGWAEHYDKPIFISETGCLARANPYDMALQICQEAGIGWFLWELMIGSSVWRDIHGVVYPDGTVRDPSIAAAIRGFYRNRTQAAVAPYVNKEGAATRALSEAAAWLASIQPDFAAGLSIAEQLANLLETGELIPLHHPPTAILSALQVTGATALPELRSSIIQWSELLRSVIQ
jgi:hypothetical protein